MYASSGAYEAILNNMDNPNSKQLLIQLNKEQ